MKEILQYLHKYLEVILTCILLIITWISFLTILTLIIQQ